MPNLISLILLLAVLSILHGLEFEHEVDQVSMRLFEDENRSCFRRIHVSSFKKTEVAFKTDDCVTCQNATLQCKRKKKGLCWLEFSPKTKFDKRGMEICVHLAKINSTSCESAIYNEYKFPLINCSTHYVDEQCALKGDTITFLFEAYNFCSFEGQISVTLQPAFYQLQFKCPSSNIYLSKSKGTVMSYYPDDDHQGKLCPVFFHSRQEHKRLCIKFRYLDFPFHGGAELIIQILANANGSQSQIAIFSVTHFPSKREWLCLYGEVKVLSVGLHNVLRRGYGHSFILDFDFDLNETIMPYPEVAEEDSSGLSKETIVAIIITCVLIFLWGYCCLSRLIKKACRQEDDIANGNISVPFDTEDGPSLATVSQRDMGVHSRARMIINQPDTDSPYHDLARGEDEASLQFLSPGAHESPSSSCDPPPSYDSLFPEAKAT